MTPPLQKGVPGRAWVVVFAGTIVNLCLGILYAWSVWKQALVYPDERMVQEMAGVAMTGINEGWRYLNNAQASTHREVVFTIVSDPVSEPRQGGSAWRPDASSRG